MDNIKIGGEHAAKLIDWLENRGGIAVWGSADLSDPTYSVFAPVLEKDGKPFGKPSWKCKNEPDRIVKDISEVDVYEPVEVKRFHVSLRIGDQGLKVKCTDASSRRIRNACDHAGEGAYYQFDYDTQECVIYVQNKLIPLAKLKESLAGIFGKDA